MSGLEEQMETTEDTGSRPVAGLPSAMPELAPTSKRTTSKDKSERCKNSFPRLKSLPISALDLTGNGKDYEKYWGKSSQENSQQLWSPTEIGCAGSDLTSLNGSVPNTVANSWFSTTLIENPEKNSLKTSQQLSTCFHADCTDSEPETIVRSKLIKLRPTRDQKVILNHWLDASRWFYNQAVEHEVDDWIRAKKFLVTNNTPEFFKDVPYQIRGCAIKEFTERLWTNRKLGKPFKMNFKSHKNPVKTAFIPLSAIKGDSFYVRSLGTDLRPSEPIKTDGDCLLVKQNGKFYLQVATKLPVSKNQASGVVSIDPGVRTFATVFSPTLVGKFAVGAATRIYKLCLHLDKLISQRVGQRPIQRLRQRIKNLIKEMHHKIARWLVNSFATIIYPAFDVSKLVMKAGRKIGSKSTRKMLTLAHGRFRDILFDKCVQAQTTLVYVSEAWTSKTCSLCGKVDSNLGGSKTIRCCKLDRDINGARGIFLRALRDTSAPLGVCN